MKIVLSGLLEFPTTVDSMSGFATTEHGWYNMYSV